MPLGPPNLSSTANSFAFPVVRRRYTASTTSSAAGSAGLRARGTATDLEILAHIWHVPGDVGEDLPESQRQSARIQGTTTTEVRAVDDEAGLPADSIVWDGIEYEIKAVTAWRSGPLGATSVWEITDARRVVRP